MRAFLLALCVVVGPLAAPLPASAEQRPATASESITTRELIEALALDRIFAQFGPAIEAAPKLQGAPFSVAEEAAWIEAAQRTFVPARMHRDLERLVGNKFTAEDHAAFETFYRSELGRRVSAADRAVAELSPDAQLTAQGAGATIGEQASPTRRAQITEMLSLMGADLSQRMMRESLRGMLVGMSVASQRRGDIVVPWEEIEFQLDAIMPQIEVEIVASQRSLAFFAYRDFADEDVGLLLDFLRTQPARKLYAVVIHAVSEVIAERMQAFGESLAEHMGRVNV